MVAIQIPTFVRLRRCFVRFHEKTRAPFTMKQFFCSINALNNTQFEIKLMMVQKIWILVVLDMVSFAYYRESVALVLMALVSHAWKVFKLRGIVLRDFFEKIWTSKYLFQLYPWAVCHLQTSHLPCILPFFLLPLIICMLIELHKMEGSFEFFVSETAFQGYAPFGNNITTAQKLA